MPENFTFPIKIGTRSSELAIAQANQVRDKILEIFPEITEDDIKIIKMTTSGDKFLDKNLSLIGGKGLFTKEIEEALIAKDIDMAVHSMKDMPAVLPDGLVLKAILKRESPRDAFISNQYQSLTTLPKNATIGTSSIRRKAAILHFRPDLKIVDFRGNINTRLRKLKEQEDIAGIILATAGLKRVGISSVITEQIPFDVMLPSIGQGAVGIEVRKNDHKLEKFVRALNHQETEFCVNLERKFMLDIDGSCKTPIACYAKYIGDKIQIKAEIIHPSGLEKRQAANIIDIDRADQEIDKIVEKFKEDGADIIKYIQDNL